MRFKTKKKESLLWFIICSLLVVLTVLGACWAEDFPPVAAADRDKVRDQVAAHLLGMMGLKRKPSVKLQKTSEVPHYMIELYKDQLDAHMEAIEEQEQDLGNQSAAAAPQEGFSRAKRSTRRTKRNTMAGPVSTTISHPLIGKSLS